MKGPSKACLEGLPPVSKDFPPLKYHFEGSAKPKGIPPKRRQTSLPARQCPLPRGYHSCLVELDVSAFTQDFR